LEQLRGLLRLIEHHVMPTGERVRTPALRERALVEHAEWALARQDGAVHIEMLLHRAIRAGKLQLLGEAAERKRVAKRIDGCGIRGVDAEIRRRWGPEA